MRQELGIVVAGVLCAGAVRAGASPREILTVKGRGVQVYRCEAPKEAAGGAQGSAAGAAPGWVLVGPEAELVDSKGEVVGRHAAGPLWRLRDGSVVWGEVVSKQPAPQPDAVPWLVLRAVRWEGEGQLRAVREIRRDATTGGVAPAEGCSAATEGTDRRVPYTAMYHFLADATAGADGH